MKRVDTRLLQADIDKVAEIAKKEQRSQSAMMRKLILEAIEYRELLVKSKNIINVK